MADKVKNTVIGIVATLLLGYVMLDLFSMAKEAPILGIAIGMLLGINILIWVSIIRSYNK